jgi:hypothetical protein
MLSKSACVNRPPLRSKRAVEFLAYTASLFITAQSFMPVTVRPRSLRCGLGETTKADEIVRGIYARAEAESILR